VNDLQIHQAAVVMVFKIEDGDWWEADRWAASVLAQNDPISVPPDEEWR
jgi:hypothetical protein